MKVLQRNHLSGGVVVKRKKPPRVLK